MNREGKSLYEEFEDWHSTQYKSLRTSKAKRPPRVSSDKLVSAAGLVWDVTVRFGRPDHRGDNEKPLLRMNRSILSVYKEAFPEEIKYSTGLSILFQWPVEGWKRKERCFVGASYSLQTTLLPVSTGSLYAVMLTVSHYHLPFGAVCWHLKLLPLCWFNLQAIT